MLKRLAIFILSSVHVFAPIWVLAVEKVSPNTPEQRIRKTDSSHKPQVLAVRALGYDSFQMMLFHKSNDAWLSRAEIESGIG